MKVYSHDGHLFIVATTGDIKDIRDAKDIVTINYIAEIKPQWFDRALKKLGLKPIIKPIRAISFTNERAYVAYINKERSKGGE